MIPECVVLPKISHDDKFKVLFVISVDNQTVIQDVSGTVWSSPCNDMPIRK